MLDDKNVNLVRARSGEGSGLRCGGKGIAPASQYCTPGRGVGGFENAKIEGDGKKEKGNMRGLHLAGDVRRRLEVCMRVGRGDRA